MAAATMLSGECGKLEWPWPATVVMAAGYLRISTAKWRSLPLRIGFVSVMVTPADKLKDQIVPKTTLYNDTQGKLPLSRNLKADR